MNKRANVRHIRTLAACQHALEHVLREHFHLFHFHQTVFVRMILYIYLFEELRKFSLIVRSFQTYYKNNNNSREAERGKENEKKRELLKQTKITNDVNNLSNCA